MSRKRRTFDVDGNLEGEPTSLARIPADASEIDRARPELVEDVREAIEANRAEQTRRLYGKAWERFSAWCRREGFQALPASPEVVSMYLGWLAKRGVPKTGRRKGKTGYAAGTLDQVRSSIAFEHRRAKFPSPTRDYTVRETMSGLKRTLPDDADPREARPLLPFHLRAMFAWLDVQAGSTPKLLQERAILLGGFVGAFRRGELVALKRRDVSITDGGIFFDVRGHQGELVAEVRKGTKTKQGERQVVDWRRDERLASEWGLDPIAVLRAWREASFGDDDDFFLRRISGDDVLGSALTARKVDRLVKECVAGIGLKARHYGAHSLRAGLATYWIHVLEKNKFDVKAHLRHESVDMLEKYVRKWDELPGGKT